MSNPLARHDIEQLQRSLQSLRDALQRQRMARFSGHSRAEHAHELLQQDGDDAPQRDADREVDQALGDRLVVEAAELDAALQRLKQGGYGLCTECGEPIPLARLRARPQVLRCLACERLRETNLPHPHTL